MAGTPGIYRAGGKRVLDVVTSGSLLVLSSPMIVAIVVLLWITQGRPFVFQQKRPGLKGRPFTLFKFRTMRPAPEQEGPAADAVRMTRVGAWLRAMSLDEWPQLWNVLIGDMSLVGPRPLLVQYLERYTREQARRHDVRPGITGWAQVRGRNAISWEEKFALDLWYVDHLSIALDLRIIAITVWKILTREGISHPGEATMAEFAGTASRETPSPHRSA